MFKWFTRNDGSRMERAKRRLRSPRGSVFTEFAIVMPIVVMVCSALIEIVGLWDAQVMANHTAWTVGRIVMVRGSDGLAFSSDLSQLSKTGIEGSKMPDALSKCLTGLNPIIQGVNQFNNRGNIAALFLMSTCGIGYFGKSPGSALSDTFKTLLDEGVKALTEGIPEWIASAVTDFTIKVDAIGGSGVMAAVTEKVNELVSRIVTEVVDWAITPLVKVLKKALQAAFDQIFGADGFKLDKLFDDDGAGARRARQLYGAAQRIVRAKSVAGQEVLTVTDMTSSSRPFLFAQSSTYDDQRHLVYPQVVDDSAKSDGYFVTGAHGWPPNKNGLAMARVEINWPYESGWLFPVVSGRAAPTVAPPLAKGHSMVFPQPKIVKANLYSKAAKAFDPGSYTGDTDVDAMDKLANEMKDYLKRVKFCMQYRICEEKLTLARGMFEIWMCCDELRSLFGNTGNADYEKSWEALKEVLPKKYEGYEIEWTRDLISGELRWNGYHEYEYFYWNGDLEDTKEAGSKEEQVHRRYGLILCEANGDLGFGGWFDGDGHWPNWHSHLYDRYGRRHDNRDEYGRYYAAVTETAHNVNGLTYANSTVNRYGWWSERSYGHTGFDNVFNAYADRTDLSDDDKKWLGKLVAELHAEAEKEKEIKEGDIIFKYHPNYGIYHVIGRFAQRNHVNVHNIVKWAAGSELEEWKEMDKAVEETAKLADKLFPAIQKLIHDEIADIDEILDSKEEKYEGNPQDPVFDEYDEETLQQDPKTAAEAARTKWTAMKGKLKAKLAEVDAAAVMLREAWRQYAGCAASYIEERRKCVDTYFVEACVNALVKTRNPHLFDPENDANFKFPAGTFPYDVVKGTRDMLDAVNVYQEAVNKAYALEVEYGAMLGLDKAEKAKREGKTPAEVIEGLEDGEEIPESGDPSEPSGPGTLSEDIIKWDRQHFEGGKWKWIK